MFLLCFFALAQVGHSFHRSSHFGRRRAEEVAFADTDLCLAINELVSDQYFEELIETIGELGSNDKTEGEVASAVGAWCHERAARRRLGEISAQEEWQIYESEMESVKPGDRSGLTMRHWANSTGFENRRNQRRMGENVPSTLWMQCVGYAYAASKMIEAGQTNGAASFIVNNRGLGGDRVNGCAAIVNSVNYGIDHGFVEGVAFNDDMAVMTLPDEGLVAQLGLQSVVLSAATVYVVLHKCISYTALAAIV